MSFLNKVLAWGRIELVDRLPWVLMGYMVGVLACFYLKINSFVLLWVIIGSAGLFYRTRQRLVWSWISLLFFFFFLGFSNLNFHIHLNQHAVLVNPLYQTRIEAKVLENHPLVDKQILTLGQIHWQSPDLKMPQKITVHYKKKDPFLHVGDMVKAVVSVYPPNESFSFAYTQKLWFDQIGATGVAQEVYVLEPVSEDISFAVIRSKINQHLFQSLPNTQAEIAAPLITGEQRLISSDAHQIYRRAGIAHVLSVSGFHMALLAAFLFFVIRGLCALFPCIVLFYNTKKIAAVVALIGTFLYLGLSGFQTPAVRAFAMISFVFLGVLVERPVLSMHSMMLVAMGLLLFKPQILFSISFQLSFMSVMVLIFVSQYLNDKNWNRFIKIMVGFISLNILVFLALSPFILYHFHQWISYGILGNMLFSGVFSFFIMPLLFMGILMMPLGLDIPFFRLAGWGLDKIRLGAQALANCPYSEIQVSGFSPLALSIVSFGLMMVCLMKTPLRWLGAFLILMGIFCGILA